MLLLQSARQSIFGSEWQFFHKKGQLLWQKTERILRLLSLSLLKDYYIKTNKKAPSCTEYNLMGYTILTSDYEMFVMVKTALRYCCFINSFKNHNLENEK